MNELPESSATGVPTELGTLDYLRGVKSSTCLLLPATPSPTPMMDFQHPLSEDTGTPFLTLNDEPNNGIDDMMQNIDTSVAGDSSSADSASDHVVHDPVSAQLINNISMLDYQTLTKNGDLSIGEVEDCIINGNITINKRKLPSFVNWNWPVIRKVLFWVVLSGLIACIAAIIAMVVTIPKTCNPDLPWHQGKVFYEIFPASFKDSNDDGIGDLKGLIKKLDYIHGLGASAIRLNYIYEAKHYPEKYYNVNEIIDLKKIDKSIGNKEDFRELVSAVHERNMSIILDIPVLSMNAPLSHNHTHSVMIANDTLISSLDLMSEALLFWSRAQNVDGFFLKRLENFVDEPNFGKTLQLWKHVIGSGRIFIASEKAYERAKHDALDVLMARIDLIDVHLDLIDGITGLKNTIERVVSGGLWSKPHYPWVHWNIGSIDSERISTKHVNNTLALTVLEFVLPGTVNIFYGDEVGLKDMPNHFEQAHILNLVPMTFISSNGKSENRNHVLPWTGHDSIMKPSYHFLDIVKSLTEVRLNTPTIYLRAIYKEGHILKNMEIRKTDKDLVVIERWYPRRNTCVFVGNLGSESITTDLSSMFYGGTVVAGTNTSLIGQVLYFDQVTFPPNSAIILKLEK